MMLGALYQLAERKNLVGDYEKRRVDYLLTLSKEGKLLGLTPTQGESGRSAEFQIPMQPKRTVGIEAGFLVDNAKYVFGIGGEKDKPDRLAKCVQAFREQVETLAGATQDEGARAVLRFFEHHAESLEKALSLRPRAEWTGSEMLAFQLFGDEQLLHQRPGIRDYWAKLRRSEVEDEAGSVMRCLVTGEVGPVARLHPSIKRVPQAQSSGAALVSFNAEAFTGYGLLQGDNAPISRAAAEGYVRAINYLLESGEGKRRFQYGIELDEGAVVVFWTAKESDAPDLLMGLFAPTEEQFRQMLESPWKGFGSSDEIEENQFYAATLGGNAARIVVRDWFASTVQEVKKNLSAYFEDLHIGRGEMRPMPIRRMLQALEGKGGGRGVGPNVATQIFQAALLKRPFPRQLLTAALARLRIPPDPKKGDELRARCALIKATLLRLPGRSWEVSVALDETSKEVPYLLGRLFAVLERLQAEAQGDTNTTIRDKYFGSASATPSLIFPRLLDLSVHHASKAERAGWLEKLKGMIIGALPAKPLPRTLSLEQRGLFAIGYYHQREKFFEGKAKQAAGTTNQDES